MPEGLQTFGIGHSVGHRDPERPGHLRDVIASHERRWELCKEWIRSRVGKAEEVVVKRAFDYAETGSYTLEQAASKAVAEYLSGELV